MKQYSFTHGVVDRLKEICWQGPSTHQNAQLYGMYELGCFTGTFLVVISIPILFFTGLGTLCLIFGPPWK